MGAVKSTAQAELATFIHDYPGLVTTAMANLAGLAKASDYPDPAAVQEAFKLDFDFSPIPPATAFQGLDEMMLESLGAQLRKRQQQAALASQAAMWERVRDAVGHLVERLANPDAMFKASSVESVRELITLLPGFNCVGDPRVDDVVRAIETMLDGVDATSLRKSAVERREVVAKAQALTDRLAQWGV